MLNTIFPADEMASLGREQELVLFRCGELVCAIPIEQVREINLRFRITRAPHARPGVVGAINLRGDVITVIDLARRMQQESTGSHRLIVVEYHGEQVALAVEDVLDVLCVTREQLQAPPPNFSLPGPACISNVIQQDDRLVFVLDVERMLAI